MNRPTTPPASTPMCDVARGITDLTKRLKHYRTCTDPRCVARATAARNLTRLLNRPNS